MSRMGDIYLEITELGYEKVKEIETKCRNTTSAVRAEELIEMLQKEYGLTSNAAMTLMLGATAYKHSRMLLREEQDRYPK